MMTNWEPMMPWWELLMLWAPIHMQSWPNVKIGSFKSVQTLLRITHLIGRQLTILETVKKSTFFDVTWRKNVTSNVDGGSVFPKRLSTENILQPTRSLYDVWCKSYGSLCVFHVWGDLDLDLQPFKVIIYVWGQHDPLVSTKKYWTFSVAEFLWYDCTLKNQCTVRVTLTYDLWRSIIFCELIISL